MSGIDETDFYQHRWHHGMLEYIEVCRTPDASALGHAGADLLTEYFRKDLPLLAVATVPDLKPRRLVVGRTVRVWVGIEVHRNKYIAVLNVRDAYPFRQGDENVILSGEHRNGIVIIEDHLKFTYDTERQIFLNERIP